MSERQDKILAAYAAKGIDNPWKAYVIDKLVCGHYYKQEDEDNPIDAIERLIDIEIWYSSQSTGENVSGDTL